MKQFMTLLSMLILTFFYVHHLCAIDTVRSAVMTEMVNASELDQSFQSVMKKLHNDIPDSALETPLEFCSRWSSNSPSSLSVRANFKNGKSYEQYIGYIEKTLKSHTPTQYRIIEERPYPSTLQAIMLGQNDYKFRKLPIPQFIEPKRKEVKPYHHPLIKPSIAQRIHFGISVTARPQNTPIHPINKQVLHHMPPKYFEDHCGDPEFAFNRYQGYEFAGFREYVRRSHKFKDFVMNLIPYVSAESINRQAGHDAYSYLYDCYQMFYEQEQRMLISQNPELLKLTKYHDLLAKGRNLLQSDNPSIEAIDQLLESLYTQLYDNPIHKDLYECALFAANTAYQAHADGNEAQHQRSLERIDKLLHSLEHEIVEEHKKYRIDHDLLQLNDYEEPNNLSRNKGLPIQNYLHDEYITINHDVAVLNGLRTLQKHVTSGQEGTSALINHYAQLAHFTNEDKKLQESFALHDTCWDLLEYSRKNTILEMFLSDPNFNTSSLSDSNVAAKHPAVSFIPTKNRMISALETIKSGTIQGVKQFCNDAINDIKLLCSDPIAYGKQYTDSLVMLGKGIYYAGYFICLSEDDQHEAIMSGCRAIKKYMDVTTLEEGVKDGIAFLTQTSLSIASGRLTAPLKTKMLSNITKIANAIDLEEKVQKRWNRIKRVLTPNKDIPKDASPATAYAILQRSEKEIQYTHATSGLLKHERKWSTKKIGKSRKRRRQKGFISHKKKRLQELKGQYSDVFSESGVEHIATGEFLVQKGMPVQLTGGCHTYDGFLYATEKTGVDLGNVVFERNNRGVMRVRTPESFMTGKALKGSGVTLLNGDKIGVKTLFPEDMKFDEIAKMGKELISNPEKYKVKNNKFRGTINGITISAYVDAKNKITTIYPEF